MIETTTNATSTSSTSLLNVRWSIGQRAFALGLDKEARAFTSTCLGAREGVGDLRRRRQGRTAGHLPLGTEDNEVAMLATRRGDDQECFVAFAVEGVADVLVGWPLLFGGERPRKADPLQAFLAVEQSGPLEIDAPALQVAGQGPSGW